MGENSRRSPRSGLWLAAALSLAALAHAPGLAGGFAWDDHILIEASPLVQDLHGPWTYLSQPFWMSSAQGEPLVYYRPLTTLSFAVDARLWRDPMGFHTTNLLLHLACVALLFALARRAGASAMTAAAAAALFGVLPRGTESVAWISGRTDLWATLGVLSALALHRSEPGAVARRAAAAGCVLLGALGKETALVAIPVLVALEGSRARTAQADGSDAAGRRGRALRNLVPLTLAALLYALLRAGAGLGSAWTDPFEPSTRALLALQALGTYALMLADPLRPRLQIGLLGDLEWLPVCVGLAVSIAGALALALAWRRRSEPALVALLLVGGALLPALHLIPLPLGVVAADRFLYLPAAGLGLLGAACAPALAARLRPRGRGSAVVVAGATLVLFVTATSARSRAWTDEVELWRSAAERAHPENPRPWSLLGEALLRRGDAAEALQVTREGLRRNDALRRRFPWADASDGIRGNLAGCLAALGRYPEAIEVMRGLVLRRPDSVKHRYNLGVLYARALRFDEALRELDSVLALRPDDGRAHRARVAVARARGRWQGLPEERPDEPATVRAVRARVYDDVGRRDEARRLWQRVAEDPTSPPGLASEARTLAAR